MNLSFYCSSSYFHIAISDSLEELVQTFWAYRMSRCYPVQASVDARTCCLKIKCWQAWCTRIIAQSFQSIDTYSSGELWLMEQLPLNWLWKVCKVGLLFAPRCESATWSVALCYTNSCIIVWFILMIVGWSRRRQGCGQFGAVVRVFWSGDGCAGSVVHNHQTGCSKSNRMVFLGLLALEQGKLGDSPLVMITVSLAHTDFFSSKAQFVFSTLNSSIAAPTLAFS